MRKDYFKGIKLLFLGKSVNLAALAISQLLCWLFWTLKAWELQLPGASISVASCTANCQGKWKPKELELPTGPPCWRWSQWLSWLTCQGAPPGFVTVPSMTRRSWQFLKNWSVFISHLWFSLPFSVLLLNLSPSNFSLKPFPLVSLSLWSFLSHIPFNLFLPSLFCFPPPAPQAAELTALALLAPSTCQTSALPQVLLKGSSIGTHHVPLFWAVLKTENERLCNGRPILPTPWIQLCFRWYEEKVALPCPELLPPPVSTDPQHRPEASYFSWTGILGACG